MGLEAEESASRALMRHDQYKEEDDVVRCFIGATFKHSKAPWGLPANNLHGPKPPWTLFRILLDIPSF